MIHDCKIQRQRDSTIEPTANRLHLWQRLRKWAGSIFVIMLLFSAHVALANGVTPTSGTDGVFTILLGNATGFGLFDPNGVTQGGAYPGCVGSGVSDITCTLSQSVSGTVYGVWHITQAGADYYYTWNQPPTPPPQSATTTINCVKATATSTDCLVQVTDNPNLDYAIGVMLFLFGMWFSIWLFRK